MRDLFNTLITVVIGLGALVLALLIFYTVASVLPGRWKERGKITVFLLPALFVTFIGLLIPACRTIYKSFFVDKQVPQFKWFANYREIFFRKDTRLTVINHLTLVVVG